EGDVLLGLPPDRLGELLRGHGRQGDLLDDDRVARQGGPELGVADVEGRHDPVDRVDDQGGVHDGAVHDRLGGGALEPGLAEPVTAALRVLQLYELDRGGPDIQPHEVFGLLEQHAIAPPKNFRRLWAFSYGYYGWLPKYQKVFP